MGSSDWSYKCAIVRIDFWNIAYDIICILIAVNIIKLIFVSFTLVNDI
jgi:hypothetical protein